MPFASLLYANWWQAKTICIMDMTDASKYDTIEEFNVDSKAEYTA